MTNVGPGFELVNFIGASHLVFVREKYFSGVPLFTSIVWALSNNHPILDKQHLVSLLVSLNTKLIYLTIGQLLFMSFHH